MKTERVAARRVANTITFHYNRTRIIILFNRAVLLNHIKLRFQVAILISSKRKGFKSDIEHSLSLYVTQYKNHVQRKALEYLAQWPRNLTHNFDSLALVSTLIRIKLPDKP